MSGPKIVIWDIEIIADMDCMFERYFGCYRGFGLNADISSIISFGYKVHGGKKAKCMNVWDKKLKFKGDINNDYELVKAAYEVLVDADAMVTHYGSKFDFPFLQARLLHWGLPPLPPIPHIDTWRIARYKLKLSSNRLDNIAKFLGTETKIDTGGFSLWKDVYNNKKGARKQMSDYCAQDVECLDQIFTQLKSMSHLLPNMSLFKDGVCCPKCGSHKVQKRGVSRTKANTYQRYHCQDCGAWSREKHPEKKGPNKDVLRGI